MRLDSGQTVSIWAATADVPTFAPLVTDVEADVCIVGVGIAGMTTAYLLTPDTAEPAFGGQKAAKWRIQAKEKQGLAVLLNLPVRRRGALERLTELPILARRSRHGCASRV